MIHIRPHHVFELVKTQSCSERAVSVVLPGFGPTPMLLETAIIVALAQAVRPQGYLEIGTYMGVQALNVAMNLDDTATVYTLDLDEPSFERMESSQHPVDREISRRHLDCRQLAYVGSEFESRIVQLRGDSTEYDFSNLVGQIDMVYIDGGHDLATVESDTRVAEQLLSDRDPSCIVWHDYGNTVYSDITRFLDDLSGRLTMYHVEETWLCFHIRAEQAESELARVAASLTGDTA